MSRIGTACALALALGFVGLPLAAAPVLAKSPATCGSDDKPETGLQGQVSITDQLTGRSAQGYSCGVKLIGQDNIGLRGNNFNLAWLKDCGYVISLASGQGPTAMEGVAVIDASNPRKPTTVSILRHSGTLDSWAIEANEARNFIVNMPANGPIGVGNGTTPLDIWDASADCKKPKLVSTFDFGGITLHEMRIAKDGNTAYFTTNAASGTRGLYILDTTDLAHPKKIMDWDPSDIEGGSNQGLFHDLGLSPDGNRAYISVNSGPNQGFMILDVSQVQARVANPKIKIVSKYPFAGPAHTSYPTTLAGRPFVIEEEESFYGAPWTWSKLFDISDEKKPQLASQVSLEVNGIDLSNERLMDKDAAIYSTHQGRFEYDEPGQSITTMVYTWFSSGLRFFDVRDPVHPKEFAYYNSPALGAATQPGTGIFAALFFNRLVDYALSDVRYLPDRNQIWFVSFYNGFQIVELTHPIDKPTVQSLANDALRPTSPDVGLPSTISAGRITIGAVLLVPILLLLFVVLPSRRST